MKRGIGLMATGTPEAAAEALTCFDQALAIRQRLPVDAAPVFAHGLAACWLNRAEALTRLGGPERWEAAVHAYDEALAVLRRLPLDDDPRYRRRLAIAHQNRGLLLVTAFPDRAAEAVDSLADALAALDAEPEAPGGPDGAAIEDRDFMRAAVLLNQAAAIRAAASADASNRAYAAVSRSLALMAPYEQQFEPAAEVGLKSRHVLCQLLAERLSQAPEGGHDMDDVHAATDTVDEGLDLALEWRRRGVTRFHDLTIDLLRFGAAVYQRFQPQFLDEFLSERQAEFSPQP